MPSLEPDDHDVKAPSHGERSAEIADLRSRLGCVMEATYWDRPYDTRLDAIRGMSDLTTDGMTPQPPAGFLVTLDHLDQWAEDAITQGIPIERYVYGVLRAALDEPPAPPICDHPAINT